MFTKEQAAQALQESVEARICSLTQQIMYDPVIVCAGHTYEKEAITAWLEQNSNNPLTGAALNDKTLTPNFFAREDISRFLSEHPEYCEQLYFPKNLFKIFSTIKLETLVRPFVNWC